MNVNWKTYKLGEVCEKIGSGATPRGGKETYLEKGEISLIRSQNVLDFTFSKNGLVFIDEQQANELKNVIVEENDVLLNITGDSVARVCQVPKGVLPARVNQHVAIIRPNTNELDKTFLKYALLNPSFKNFMLGLASTGGTRNALTKGMIENFEILAPKNITEQQSIASILSSLDDKIQLNKQMNQTIEATAESIFKEWFVNLNFPGLDGELLNELPPGWTPGVIENLFILQRGFDLPATQRTEGIYPVVAASGISSYHNEYKVKGPGVTTGRSGVLGNVYYITDDFWPLNTSLFIKEYRNSTPLFAYYVLKGLNLFQLNGGSAVPTLNRNDVHRLSCIIPPLAKIKEFEDIAASLFRRIYENEKENQILTGIRDSLLPKLMTGNIEVKV